MSTPRRYRVRLYHHGEEIQTDQHTYAALDLHTGLGLLIADALMKALMRSMAYQLRYTGPAIRDFRLTVQELTAGGTPVDQAPAVSFYPNPDDTL